MASRIDPRLAKVACCLLLAALTMTCHREEGDEAPANPEVRWEDTWPVLVLSDPTATAPGSPGEAQARLWLMPPSASADPWPDPWLLEARLGGAEPAARTGLARALVTAADAYESVAALDAAALCTLARQRESFGAEVVEGYLFGMEACLWNGDAGGAGIAWDHWVEFSTPDTPFHGTWPPPPVRGAEAEGLGSRVLPVGGLPPDGDGGAPGVAYLTTYEARGQRVEYAFVLPGDLSAAAADLPRRASEVLAACEGCSAGVHGLLLGDGDGAGELCAAAPLESLPWLMGSGQLHPEDACRGSRPRKAPRYPGAGTAGAAALDAEIAAFLDTYVAAIEGGAVADGRIPAEGLPSLRAMTARAVTRSVGLAALDAGDGATALWALETAVGPGGGVPRGANDPSMLCALALARFRAGQHAGTVRILDALGALPGWEALAPVARAVARVEALPGAAPTAVMR